MVVSGYTLHLYCDCPECTDSPASGEYTGETYGECAAQARADGWHISRDRAACTAPGHKKPS